MVQLATELYPDGCRRPIGSPHRFAMGSLPLPLQSAGEGSSLLLAASRDLLIGGLKPGGDGGAGIAPARCPEMRLAQLGHEGRPHPGAASGQELGTDAELLAD